MNWETLEKFIEEEDKRIRNRYYNYPDEEKRAYARIVKLVEEVGEFSNEALSFFSKQRPEKLEKHNKQKMAEECADVMIVLLLTARVLKIDVSDALTQKMKKLKERK